jgi:KaiC/GvpD/RAD55 family RecA-like ATPase
MISIKKNKALKLDIPDFICDNNPIGEHLNKYDMLKHLNAYSTTCIIGKPGSGKTSLLISFLKGRGKNKIFRKSFDHILLVMPSSSRNSMKNNIFSDHPEDKMYEELNIETINSIYQRLLTTTAESENTLLILDDVGASLKDNQIKNTLRKIIFNRRHLKCHLVMLLQSFISCPREIRKLFTNVFIFKPSKVEFQVLFDELFETAKDKTMEIMRLAYDKPHQYLMLNIEHQKLFKGFDEIIVHNDEEK